MKKGICVCLLAALLLTLTGCGGGGKKKQGSWQEQYDLGIRYLEEGRYEEAVIAFQAAIEINPKEAQSYVALSETYRASGDYRMALKTLETAAEKSENLETVAEQMNVDLDKRMEALREKAGEQERQEDAPGASQEVLDMIEMTEMLAAEGAVSHDDMPSYDGAVYDGLESRVGLDENEAEKTKYQDEENGSFRFQGMDLNYELEVQCCDYLLDGKRFVTAMADGSGERLVGVRYSLADGAGEGREIGLRDVALGDSLETVSEKLGLDAEVLKKHSCVLLELFGENGAGAGMTADEVLSFDGETYERTVGLAFFARNSSDPEQEAERLVVLGFDGDDRLTAAGVVMLDAVLELSE